MTESANIDHHGWENNMLQTEQSDGRIRIIDADGKRFITIDNTNKTYSSMTFDEFKAALQKAQERAKEQQAKEVSKHPEAANVKITPKIDVQETGATRTVLNLPTKEVKMKIDMQMESTDPKAQEKAESMSMTVTSDSWVAASIPGYGEVREFLRKASQRTGLAAGNDGQHGGHEHESADGSGHGRVPQELGQTTRHAPVADHDHGNGSARPAGTGAASSAHSSAERRLETYQCA